MIKINQSPSKTTLKEGEFPCRDEERTYISAKTADGKADISKDTHTVKHSTVMYMPRRMPKLKRNSAI